MLENAILLALLLVPLSWTAWLAWEGDRLDQKVRYITGYSFADGIRRTLKERYPHLRDADVSRLEEGLKTYFKLVARHGPQLAMPSRAVDAVWHEFLLYTVDYAEFCQRAFGRFFHHVPFDALPSHRLAEISLSNVWMHACNAEDIDPVFPARLPELFALDAELGIPDGFLHSLDNDYYPLSPAGVSPELLEDEILHNLQDEPPGANRDHCVARLAYYIRGSLAQPRYGNIHMTTDLKLLLIAMEEHEDLMAAAFGDATMAQTRDEFMKALAKREEQEKSASCGGGGCGGCGGGC